MNDIMINMDLSRPHTGIAATIDGDALMALVGADRLTGRQVARLVRRGSQPAVNTALNRLARQGLVHRESVPPAMLYSLNRDHVGYPAVEALAAMRTEFLSRLRELLAGWETPAVHVSLFGSAARADGDADSDIDLLVIRPRGVVEEDEHWQTQLSRLADSVRAWTGNAASIIELEEGALSSALASGIPALVAWRDDAIVLAGSSVETVIGKAR